MSNKHLEKPPLDTNNVRIELLTTSPEGLTVETRNTLARTALGRPHITDEQAGSLRDKLRNESKKFQGIDEYEKVRKEFGPHSPEGLAAWAEHRRKAASGKKIGLRSIDFEAETNTVSVDVMNVPYPVSLEFANPESTDELLELTMPTGNAVAIITSDDKLIIQHRAVEKPRMLGEGKVQGNGTYADVPGTSAGGKFDALPGETPAVPKKINNELIMDSIKKEIHEELGLGDDSVVDLKIVGIAKDKVQPHDEFLLYARSPLTAKEVFDASSKTKRNQKLGDADFGEKFITIDATPKAIETLLCDVKSPVPATHAASIFATGYSIVLEKDGQDAANEWRVQVEARMNENENKINQIVHDYYAKYPKAKTQTPERYWGSNIPPRNLGGYSPSYTPEEQGLPSLENELVRTGLKRETRNTVKRIHLFDVDGPLSDPHERRVIHNELFDEMIDRLYANEPIALNTGRSTTWAIENVIEPLKARLIDRALIQKLCVIGEKGNTWATYDKQGKVHHGRAESATIPENLREKILQLMESSPEYSSMMTMAVDPYKVTMLSPEMSPIPEGVTNEDHLAKFHEAQQRFAEEVTALIEAEDMSKLFEVDKTTIATDLQSPYAGKDLGADRYLEILDAMDINAGAATFVTYGDSKSDLAMADQLEQRGLTGEFVYVGKGTVSADENYDYEIIQDGEDYSSATLRYLYANK